MLSYFVIFNYLHCSVSAKPELWPQDKQYSKHRLLAVIYVTRCGTKWGQPSCMVHLCKKFEIIFQQKVKSLETKLQHFLKTHTNNKEYPLKVLQQWLLTIKTNHPNYNYILERAEWKYITWKSRNNYNCIEDKNLFQHKGPEMTNAFPAAQKNSLHGAV